jgi:Sec-independent protein secretion pathway component TatC
LVALYFVGIVVSWVVVRRRARRLAAPVEAQ